MDGFIIVDKPKGLTSFKVVSIVKGIFKLKKVGHAGTLDPMATGVLVLAIGKATKQISNYLEADKTYDGTMTLGTVTDSQDITGEVTATYDGDIDFSEDELEAAFDDFRGDIMQIPPMVSAVKHKGKRLYKIAREGKTVKRDPRPVTIFDLKINEVRLPEIDFTVTCSKGTYVRTLSHDIGEKLGTGATLSALRRTASNPFLIEKAYTLDELREMSVDEFKEALIPVENK